MPPELLPSEDESPSPVDVEPPVEPPVVGDEVEPPESSGSVAAPVESVPPPVLDPLEVKVSVADTGEVVPLLDAPPPESRNGSSTSGEQPETASIEAKVIQR